MAEFYADTEPQRALQWRAQHPRALLNLAEQRLAQVRLDEAATLARRSLAADPLDGRGYRVLGNVAGLKRDRNRQQAMMNLAVMHAPRDVAARAWSAQIALEQGDAATAVRHYDRMLRVAPAQLPSVFPVLMGLVSIPEARAALVSTLATHPPWRAEFLRDAAAGLPNSDDVSALFGQLRAEGGLSADERADYLGRLVKDRRWDQAFVAWAGGLSAQRLANVSAPMNGGFEDPSPASGPFDWLITRRPGVDAAVTVLPDGSGHALRLEFQGQRSEFRDVRQLLLLPAARGYRLEWRSRFDGLETARGLRWTVTCADGPAGQVLATPPTSGTQPWRKSAAVFDVPPDCPAQWLVLELDARIAAETQSRGTAWFDDVRIVSRGGS
jgi:tetratricopeptide (TPR) repeat protein